MSNEVTNTPKAAEIGHKVGDHNIQVLGLDIHNPVFVISAALVIALLTGTLLYLEAAARVFVEMRAWVTIKFDWFFMISANFFAPRGSF